MNTYNATNVPNKLKTQTSLQAPIKTFEEDRIPGVL